jgi:hypothetical protein
MVGTVGGKENPKEAVLVLYVDIPTASDLLSLAEQRHPVSVSLYLPTTPVTTKAQASRIELKSLARSALQELEQRDTDAGDIAAVDDLVRSLVDDAEFWRFQAHGLAVFATPHSIRHYRLPNRLELRCSISDRFQIAQLLRSVTFPNAGYVLVLSEGGVRLVEVSPDLPASTVPLPDLPETIDGFLSQPLGDRLPRQGPRGSQGDASAQRQFARKINSVVRDHLRGSGLPLVLAATEPMASIYRSVNSYPRLAETGITGSAEPLTDNAAAEKARPVFDAVYRAEVDDWCRTYEQRENQSRATTDVATAARAATFGAVDSLLIDMTTQQFGTMDETNGTVTFADSEVPGTYCVINEIAARVIRGGGRVLAVHSEDIPGGAALAGILRYPV